MSAEKHLYIGSGAAVRSVWNGSHNSVTIEHRSYTYIGDSQGEAYAWAMGDLQRAYPMREGYSHHHVRVDEVSPEDLEMILAAVAAPGPAEAEGGAG